MNEIFLRTEVSNDLEKIKPLDLLINEITNYIFTREITEISARDEDI